MENLITYHTALLTGTSLSALAVKAQVRASVATRGTLGSPQGDEQERTQTDVTEQNLGLSIALANDLLRRHATELEFTLQHTSGGDIVQLRDIHSGQVIKEYSSQAIMAMVSALCSTVSGLLDDMA